MHINPLFICSLLPECSYFLFDECGQLVDLPIYLATGSLLPIVTDLSSVSSGYVVASRAATSG